jgi:hypothetical protein
MAIVKDSSGNGGGTTGSGPENAYSGVTVAASAIHGTTTPGFVGQRATDITADQNYQGKRVDVTSEAALANTDWVKIP